MKFNSFAELNLSIWAQGARERGSVKLALTPLTFEGVVSSILVGRNVREEIKAAKAAKAARRAEARRVALAAKAAKVNDSEAALPAISEKSSKRAAASMQLVLAEAIKAERLARASSRLDRARLNLDSVVKATESWDNLLSAGFIVNLAASACVKAEKSLLALGGWGAVILALDYIL